MDINIFETRFKSKNKALQRKACWEVIKAMKRDLSRRLPLDIGVESSQWTKPVRFVQLFLERFIRSPMKSDTGNGTLIRSLLVNTNLQKLTLILAIYIHQALIWVRIESESICFNRMVCFRRLVGKLPSLHINNSLKLFLSFPVMNFHISKQKYL